MYMLIVYTYDDCLVYRCKSFNHCLHTIQTLSTLYTIIGLDIHKVPKTDISVRRA